MNGPSIPGREADQASIPINYSRLIARELDIQERDLPRLLADTGLDPRCLIDQETWLSSSQQSQIVQNALDISGRPEIGLPIGQQMRPSVHGPIGYLATSSPDLRTALGSLQEFLPLRVRFVRMTMQETQDWLACDLHLELAAPAHIRRTVLEAIIQVVQHVAEFVIGRPLVEGQIDLEFPAPTYHRLYSAFFNSPFHFQRPQTSYRLPIALAATPNAIGDHEAYAVARDQCERMAAQLRSRSQTVANQVRKILLSRPPGPLREEDVARALYIAPRTLARRLRREGQSFRQLRDEIASGLAARHLRESKLSVEAVAHLLGYHDAANFRRAFKRWYGVTPQAYRTNEKRPQVEA